MRLFAQVLGELINCLNVDILADLIYVSFQLINGLQKPLKSFNCIIWRGISGKTILLVVCLLQNFNVVPLWNKHINVSIN